MCFRERRREGKCVIEKKEGKHEDKESVLQREEREEMCERGNMLEKGEGKMLERAGERGNVC